jgi:hypothetical protein
MRPKKCPECGEKYQPTRQLQPCCEKEDCRVSYAIRHIEATRNRRKMRAIKEERVAQIADRKVIKIKRDKLKTARDWTRETQIAFNSYIRERDKEQPCICCNQPLSSGDVGGRYDCGHYRSVGSAPHLRFDPRNAHAQRKQCNRWGAGRAVDYRLGLIARIGIEAVEALESDNEPRKYSIEELKAIKAYYIAKRKALIK